MWLAASKRLRFLPRVPAPLFCALLLFLFVQKYSHESWVASVVEKELRQQCAPLSFPHPHVLADPKPKAFCWGKFANPAPLYSYW